jgi:hypothetical protein
VADDEIDADLLLSALLVVDVDVEAEVEFVVVVAALVAAAAAAVAAAAAAASLRAFKLTINLFNTTYSEKNNFQR